MKFFRLPLDPVDIINIFSVAQQLKSFLGRLIVEVSRSYKISYTTPNMTSLKDLVTASQRPLTYT
jgi:hypothetical protein